MNVSIRNMFGTLVLLMGFLAINPILDKAISLLGAQLGPTETFMVKLIPFLFLSGIILNLFEDDEPGGVGV